MPRQYKRKTDNGLIGHDALVAAVKEVVDKKSLYVQ